MLENSAPVAQSCVDLRVWKEIMERERREKGNERKDNFPRRIGEERGRKKSESGEKRARKGGGEGGVWFEETAGSLIYK